MNIEEIRAAASSAARRVGQERTDYIQSSYQEEYWQEITHLAEMIDDWANNKAESSRCEPCLYNRGVHYEV